jgi:hypothetical protein
LARQISFVFPTQPDENDSQADKRNSEGGCVRFGHPRPSHSRRRRQTLSPAPNERTIQGKLMRKVTIGLLVLGVVVLIVWNWLWLWAPEWLFDLLSQQTASPVAAVLSMREWVQIIVSVVLLIASL